MLAVNCNVLGTTNIMEAALQNKVKKIVYASTWEVYGKAQYEPIDEKHPCNPDHPYNITKLAGENMVFSYNKLKGVNAVALRLGTAYGEGLRDNSVFALFINKALDKTPITIQGEGKQFRQFVHAEDIGRAFSLAISSTVNGEAFNIVGKEKISIKNLAEMVAEKIPTEIKHESARVGDVPSATVAFEKAGRQLKWKQEISFKEGLNRLMEHYARKRNEK
jgi:UDP-glucose 4-epimerase